MKVQRFALQITGLASAIAAALYAGSVGAESPPAPTQKDAQAATSAPLEARCTQILAGLPGKIDENSPLSDICHSALQVPGCVSVKNKPIFHWEKGAQKSGGKRILVFGLIHGDEGESGSLVRQWLLRLHRISDNRNAWRIVPVLNPDGYEAATRVNANGIDLNRNFPTQDWVGGAANYWKKTGKNPRRFPGKEAGSEPETKCAIQQIEDFKPDLIVSVHTPYSLIDFDGPKAPLPRVSRHPIKRLGNFPGSLGRYMWADRKIPVLTVELAEGPQPLKLPESEGLQDSIGDLAAKAGRIVANSGANSSDEAHPVAGKTPAKEASATPVKKSVKK